MGRPYQGMYNTYKMHCRLAGVEFNLTEDQFTRSIPSDCQICNCPFGEIAPRLTKKNFNSDYGPDNRLWICSDCDRKGRIEHKRLVGAFENKDSSCTQNVVAATTPALPAVAATPFAAREVNENILIDDLNWLDMDIVRKTTKSFIRRLAKMISIERNEIIRIVNLAAYAQNGKTTEEKLSWIIKKIKERSATRDDFPKKHTKQNEDDEE